MKKHLSLILCTVLAACLLAACGGSDAGNGGTPSANGGAGQTAAEDAYVFTYNGVEIPMDADAAPIIAALGDPVDYQEAASCAFDGLDKIYTYASFEVDTYPDGDTDRISAVILKDDMVETAEGLAIGAPVADVAAAYGEKAAEAGTIVSEKGGSELWFVVQSGDTVLSIEYHSTVL